MTALAGLDGRVTALAVVARTTPGRRPLTDADRDRVDAAAIDRAWLARIPLGRWCERAKSGEQKIRRWHEETTTGDVIAAWRCLFANRHHTGGPLRRTGYLWWERPW